MSLEFDRAHGLVIKEACMFNHSSLGSFFCATGRSVRELSNIAGQLQDGSTLDGSVGSSTVVVGASGQSWLPRGRSFFGGLLLASTSSASSGKETSVSAELSACMAPELDHLLLGLSDKVVSRVELDGSCCRGSPSDGVCGP